MAEIKITIKRDVCSCDAKCSMLSTNSTFISAASFTANCGRTELKLESTKSANIGN